MGKTINKSKTNKRVIKFLALCKNPKMTQSIIKQSGDGIIKDIFNATLNVINNKK